VFVGQSGALEPRVVVLGARAGDRFQIDRGLAAGERIVASANFLVDAESRLTAGAGLSAMPGMNMGAEKRP
jgi:Cu(I)/Ag(I) efflux system membrane fusion protein